MGQHGATAGHKREEFVEHVVSALPPYALVCLKILIVAAVLWLIYLIRERVAARSDWVPAFKWDDEDREAEDAPDAWKAVRASLSIFRAAVADATRRLSADEEWKDINDAVEDIGQQIATCDPSTMAIPDLKLDMPSEKAPFELIASSLRRIHGSWSLARMGEAQERLGELVRAGKRAQAALHIAGQSCTQLDFCCQSAARSAQAEQDLRSLQRDTQRLELVLRKDLPRFLDELDWSVHGPTLEANGLVRFGAGPGDPIDPDRHIVAGKNFPPEGAELPVGSALACVEDGYEVVLNEPPVGTEGANYILRKATIIVVAGS